MVTVDIVSSLEDWLDERLGAIDCSPDARAYVLGVLSSFKRSDNDIGNESIVVAYASARFSGKFEQFQRIGDWVLWASTLAPGSIDRERELVESLGRMSYYACHRIVRRTWPVYEELADELPVISVKVRNNLGLSVGCAI